MNKKRKPATKWASYCTVTCGKFVFVKMPELDARWSLVTRRLFQAIKRDLGIKAKEVWGIEGELNASGPFCGVTKEQHARFLGRVERAFKGDPACLPDFHLYAWKETGTAEFVDGIFELIRKATNIH